MQLVLVATALLGKVSSWDRPSGIMTGHDDTRFKVVGRNPEWIVSPHTQFHAEQKELHAHQAQAAKARKVTLKRRRMELMAVGADEVKVDVAAVCEDAEDSAANAFTEAAVKHSAAEQAAMTLSVASSNHHKAKHLFDAKVAEFNAAKAALCPVTLEYTSDATAFKANLEQVAKLAPMSEEAVTLEALMNANMTIMTAARVNYSDMAAAANSADAAVAANEDGRDVSCMSVATSSPALLSSSSTAAGAASAPSQDDFTKADLTKADLTKAEASTEITAKSEALKKLLHEARQSRAAYAERERQRSRA